jgi:acyl-coenzyme A synthetase/AMP-(fatty) acid ligase
VAIIGDDGPVEIGQEGTIAIHKDDPGLMLGYLGHPDETKAKFAGPWFLTGDRGTMDAEGHVSYLGRADDMMNAGGYRVSPLEVEAAFATFPGLSDCAAIEMEVRKDVRVVGLYYCAPSPIAEADLQAWGAERLARYKQPRIYCQIDAMPRSTNGKLMRKALPRQVSA